MNLPGKYRLSRRSCTIIAIAIMVVILSSAFLFVWYKDYPAGKNKKLVDVKISNFCLTGAWEPVGGLALVLPFNLTVVNSGQADVSTLVLKVRMFDNRTDTHIGNYFYDFLENGTDYYPVSENGTILQPLKVGEIRVFTGVMQCTIGQIQYPQNTTITRYYEALIILNNSTIDDRIIS